MAGAGPVAAAAAGAAAAAAVAAALGEDSQDLVPYHSSITLTEIDPNTKSQPLSRVLLAAQEEAGSHTRIFERVRSLSPRAFSDAMFEGPQASQIRRSESFDMGCSNSTSNNRLVRSESEVWGNAGHSQCNGSDSLKVGHHQRGSSFSEYSDHIQHETPSMRPSYHTGKSETNGNSHSGLPLMRVATSSVQGQGNGKDNTRKSDSSRLTLERPRNGQKYTLDVGRHQLPSRIGKPLNGKRLPERIVSLLPSATEILLEIGKLTSFSALKLFSVFLLGWNKRNCSNLEAVFSFLFIC